MLGGSQTGAMQKAMESYRSFLSRMHERMAPKSYSPPPAGESPRLFWTDRRVQASAENVRRARAVRDRRRTLAAATAVGVFLAVFLGGALFIADGADVHSAHPLLVRAWLVLVAASYGILSLTTLAAYLGIIGLAVRLLFTKGLGQSKASIPEQSPLRHVKFKKRSRHVTEQHGRFHAC